MQRLGFKLVERNYRTPMGELDLIVTDGVALVFAEVKTATSGAAIRPFERLHADKRRRVRWMACAWLRDRAPRPRPQLLRFDAIGVIVDRDGRLMALEHLEAAF